MGPWLKQSTNATIQLGPFVDKTTPNTEETGLTLTVECSKDGGAFAARNAAAAASHDSNGWYRVPLSTKDTNTVGSLIVKSDSAADHLPVWREFFILPQNVYNVFATNTAISTLTLAAVNTSSAANAALTAKGLTIAGVAALSKVTNASAQTACNSSLTARGLTAANVAAFSRVTNASVKTACNTAYRVRKLYSVTVGNTVANTNTVKYYNPANNYLDGTIVYNTTDGGRDTVTLTA